ncbi:hypothetical protein [Pseudarthrobacter sp. H2]|uniref:hypothetical protein n=1 Tax=Pseudarthrobacter sp. H2 TaxID=3418415 RepID=UPI003CE8DEC6
MSKLIELLEDAYPFGCKGDVIKVTKEGLAELDKIAKRVEGSTIYKEFVDAAGRAEKAVEAEVVKVEDKAAKEGKK